MKSIVIGIHFQRDDVEPVTTAIPVENLFASVHAVDDDRPLADRDLLIEIAAVRARLLDRATFIAIRYGFSVRDANELASKCAGRTAKWRALLVEHRDEVEMTLKAPAAARPPRPDRRDFESGAAYLRALHEVAHTADLDPNFRGAVERTLVRRATGHRWIREAASVELAMLVRRSDLAAIRDAGEQLRAEFASTPFLLSGPWPLEVFSADDHQ
ncbi:MAG TPA: GvpL/GvpF family gas vesicle protein [Thermoanaerobaculia bacterium]|nr:GvpL/GvpF family gas vesicle protein [Thermoanaerobaculia bacterium]